MSAREELHKALTQGVACSSDYAGFLIDNLLEEEAEKIRKQARATSKPGSPGYAGLMTGADLIDPYAKGE